MKVRIDKAGRIVVPKPVRDRLGLEPNAVLDLVEQAGGAFIKARREGATLSIVNGVLVHNGQTSNDVDWDTVVDRVREERIQSILP